MDDWSARARGDILTSVQKAVFLDRDNTLIANDGDLGDPDVVHLLEGVPQGLRRLRNAGYRLIVVTNQAGVARGAFTEDDVDQVHQRIASLIDHEAKASRLIDRFYYCPYHPEGKIDEYRRDHPWRKPQPGMLVQAAHDLDLDLSDSWIIGDQARDVDAGEAAGCRTVLINPNGRKIEADPTVGVRSFSEAVEAILGAPPRFIESVLDSTGELVDAPERSTNPTVSARDETAPVTPTDLRRAVIDLTEEIRADRMRRGEFTALRLAAGLCQLLAVLLAVLGLLQLGSADAFVKWMVSAIFVQLITIAMLVMDSRG